MKKTLQNNQKWPLSLQGKFILAASLCIVVFSLVVNAVVVSREENFHKQEMLNQCKVISEISRITLTNVMVFNEIGILDKRDLVDYLDYFSINLMAHDKRIKQITIIDEVGNVLTNNSVVELEIDRQFLNEKPYITDTKITNGFIGKERIHSIAIPLNIKTKHWGMMLIGISMEDMYKAIDSKKNEIIVLVITLSTLCLVIISVGSKILSRPIVHIAEIMDGIKTHGDLEEEHIEFRQRRDEIGKLQRSLIWMLQRLKDADAERKKTVEVLRQTEKMVSIGRLASGVAHEINNPLGGITVCFKNLMKPGMDEEDKQEHIDLINDCLQRIKNIVDHLLDFSKMTITEKSMTDLNGLLNRLLLLVKYATTEKSIAIVRNFSEYLPEISVDQGKLGQVFLNMIINAIHAMDNGGILTIRTRQMGNFYEVLIQDTGIGIPSEILPQIFDPFFTTKAVGIGTGLGLSVSKSIIEQHGGEIEVESEVGVGTAFKVRLPVEQG